MDCNETRSLLEADVDGELDLVRHLEIERHLAVCPVCAERAEALRARQTALRERLPRFAAGAELAQRIRTAIRAEAGTPTSVAAAPPASTNVVSFPPPAAATRRSVMPWSFWTTSGLAASLMLAVGLGFLLGHGNAAGERLVTEAVAEHVRSLQVDHLLDVVSTDQHTVKPWFAGKLDFSPPVVDLPDFKLVGGRLDHIDDHAAAALVFHRRQHAINLFIWPSSRASIGSTTTTRDGYHVQTWTDRDLNFLAISEIPAAELNDFVAAYRAATRITREP